MIDLLEEHLKRAPGFTEIRAVDLTSSNISIKNGKVDTIVSASSPAFSVRVFVNGAFGFASTNLPEKLGEAVEKASRLAKVSAKRNLEARLSQEKIVKDFVQFKPKKNIMDYSLEQKTKDMLELNKTMKIDPRIVSADIAYHDSQISSYYVNSEGSNIRFDSNSCKLLFFTFAKQDSLQMVAEAHGGMRGYENIDLYWDKGKENAQRTLELLKAKPLKSGNYDVVIDPKMAGTLAHEAVGHACEADLVLTGESAFRGKIGKKICDESVTICDNPTIPWANGSFPYDDEGVKTRKTTLIENGILKNYLHSRETASKFDTHSSGNARAQGVSSFPIVRMSNTYFEPGDNSKEEVFDLKKGIYIEGMRGGTVDTASGNFQFTGEMGYLIENGELTAPLKDLSIYGNILETLKKVNAMGKEMGDWTPGSCGKSSQSVRVSDNGPYMQLKGVSVGGSG